MVPEKGRKTVVCIIVSLLWWLWLLFVACVLIVTHFAADVDDIQQAADARSG